MHFEFNKFRNNSIKLWHFHIWIFFVKITFKYFARYYNQDLIFSFDWIFYIYSRFDCFLYHLDHIIEINFDFLNQTPREEQDKFKIKIQHIYRNFEILILFHVIYFFERYEAFLLNSYSFIEKNAIFNKYLNIKMNYASAPLSQIDLIINIIIIRFFLNEKKWI